ncbi:hypothetical protein Emag_007437 [Eimeria magna]
MSRASSRASTLLGKSAVSGSRAPTHSRPSAAAGGGSGAAAAAADAASSNTAARLRSHTAELEAIFRCIDRDHDGHVSLSDLSFFLTETLHQKSSEKDIAALLDEIVGVGAPRSARDGRGGGGAPLLSFSSFLGFVDRQLNSCPLEEALRPIFSLLDRDNDGKASASDINEFSAAVGLRLGEDGASQLLKSAGATGDAIDFPLFCSLVAKSLPS